MKRNKIIHLIPSNSIGGVESAAKTSINIKSDKYIFKLKFLSKQKYNSKFIQRIFSLIDITFSTIEVINYKPDFLLVSLWKSCLSAIFIKLANPKTKIILFLHCTKSANFIDYCFNKFLARFSYQIWGDSMSTLKERSLELGINPKKKKRVISFISYKFDPSKSKVFKPIFIFWGRYSSEKRIELAIELFNEISKNLDDARFLLIGLDNGKLKSLKELSNRLKLNKKIKFFKSKSIREIIKYANKSSFFLQLSDHEGLGMSVVESMQLGLIPIVTNIGEIKNYCLHGQNSLIFSNIKKTSEEILTLINYPKKMNYLKKNAIKTWSKQITYRDDISKALEELNE